MIVCDSCGSQMFFDIPSQQMKCRHCEQKMDVYQSEEYEKYAAQDTFETTVYRCSQCGAELMSQDNSAVSFCSFCGTQALLPGELRSVKKPEKVIPFKKTKQDCKDIYKKRLRRALYAPSVMTSSDHIDGFRGIYMPYYLYDVEQDGPIRLHGTRSYRRGDYVYTEHHDLTANIKGRYPAISHDASTDFADNVSESIAPYDNNEIKEFSTGFLHGFYADTCNMDKNEYRRYATDMANEYAITKARTLPEFSRFSITENKSTPNLSSKLNTGVRDIKYAMFPVWFLSLKRGGRMSYATINGETGRVYADIPVSIYKFLIGTLLLAVPLFFMLQGVAFLTPMNVTIAFALLSSVVAVLYGVAVRSILQHEQEMTEGDKPKAKKNTAGAVGGGLFVALIVGFFIFIEMGDGASEAVETLFSSSILCAICLVVAIIAAVYGINKQKKVFELDSKAGFFLPVIGISFLTLCSFIAPVEDAWYYMTAAIAFAADAATFAYLLKAYNIFSTRMPRTFMRQGGDDLGI